MTNIDVWIILIKCIHIIGKEKNITLIFFYTSVLYCFQIIIVSSCLQYSKLAKIDNNIFSLIIRKYDNSVNKISISLNMELKLLINKNCKSIYFHDWLKLSCLIRDSHKFWNFYFFIFLFNSFDRPGKLHLLSCVSLLSL